MSRRNGGIIGPVNTPVGGLFKGVAGGVWRMNDVLTFVSNNQWPKGPENIENSCRFNDGSSDYLSRATSTATNSKKYTLSLWVKRGNISSTQAFITYDSGGTAQENIRFNSDNTILWYHRTSGGTTYNLTTNRVFRDVSAWYHIVVAVDTTQATDSNRVKLYINGVQETSFSTETYPAQNLDLFINNNNTVDLFRFQGGSSYFDGYASEVVMIDGSQLDPTSFGEFDSTTGIWKPKKIGQFTSAGDNSFYLDFKDSSTLGNDASGLNNDFTVNNLTSIDQSTDTCVENFATLNFLTPNYGSGNKIYSNGNLTFTLGANNWETTFSTFALTQGKWYCETKIEDLSSSTGYSHFGIGDINQKNFSDSDFLSDSKTCGIVFDYRTGQSKFRRNGSVYQDVAVNFAIGDIVGMAIDIDNSHLYFHKNGTYLTIDSNVGDPTSGSSGTGGLDFFTGGINFAVGVAAYSANAGLHLNFGSPPYSISSGNSDANGFGNFEYAVPSGYYAINTTNLNTYG